MGFEGGGFETRPYVFGHRMLCYYHSVTRRLLRRPPEADSSQRHTGGHLDSCSRQEWHILAVSIQLSVVSEIASSSARGVRHRRIAMTCGRAPGFRRPDPVGDRSGRNDIQRATHRVAPTMDFRTDGGVCPTTCGLIFIRGAYAIGGRTPCEIPLAPFTKGGKL